MTTSSSNRSNVAHLLRRAGFGPTPADLDSAVKSGFDATVQRLLDFSATDPADQLQPPDMQWYPANLVGVGGNPSPDIIRQRDQFVRDQAKETPALIQWWLQRMQTTVHPLREKLTLLWHGNFATGINKVRLPLPMFNQNQLFRSLGNGNFEKLTQGVAKDPAMMLWLDTISDKSLHPNENFARELMERFTMGIGNYTESDVREGSRGFTGWTINPVTGQYAFNQRQFDSGTKTYLGQTGNLTGDDVVHIAVNTDASHRWVTSRLWSFLAYPVAPDDPLVVNDLVPGYARDLDVTGLLRTIFTHPKFVSDTAKNGLVKQPVEYAVGALTALGIPFTADNAAVRYLKLLGQIPFDPPNVGGWPQNQYWLSTASSLARWQFAQLAARNGDISSVEQASAKDRPDATAALLGVADPWSATTATALKDAAQDPAQVVTLALVSPEYVSN